VAERGRQGQQAAANGGVQLAAYGP